MANTIQGLKPSLLWNHFYNLTQIPRPSKHEEKVVAHIVDFGKSLGLETFTDKAGNIIIKKPASAGMEKKRGVILQSHVDMVPQKNNDTQHDFLKDPIKPYIDGDWVKAEGTTLGSDNGIGVAAIMAILEDKSLKHGPVEALLTIDEETGMTGAFGLEPGVLKGDILLNLDSEEEGELCVGCAGGLDADIQYKYKTSVRKSSHITYKITLKGLKGGHSGMDINLGRGNSVKLLSRFLLETSEKLEIRLAEFEGGNLRNAIPREASALVAVNESKFPDLKNAVDMFQQTLKNEIGQTEPDVRIEISEGEAAHGVLQEADQLKLLKAAMAAPNGVIRMSDSIPGLVETSLNFASLKIKNNTARFTFLLRSSIDSAKSALALQVKSLFDLIESNVAFSGAYPGWKPNPSSAILDVTKSLYSKLFNSKPEVKAVHAGLECGILGATYPSWDMISFGPTIKYPHSPDEMVNIPSVEKFWLYLCQVLENIPEK